MKKKLLTALLAGIVLFLITGCGKEKPLSDNSSDSQIGGAGESDESAGMIRAANADALFPQKCIPLSLDLPNSPEYSKILVGDSYDGKFYLLSKSWKKLEGIYSCQYALHIFDGETMQLESRPFHLELPDKGAYYISFMDVKGSNELSFRLSRPDSEDGEDFYESLAITDMDGNLLSLEKDFPDSDNYPWNADYREYLTAFDNPDGSTILCQWNFDTECSSLFWFDKEQGTRSPLGELPGQHLTSLYLDRQNNLYYVAEGKLTRWNLANDTRQELSRLTDIGVSFFADYTGLVFNSAGEALLCTITANSNAKVFVLSDEEIQAEEEIRFAYLKEELPRYTVKLASSYSYEHLQCPIKTENIFGTDLRDRILMELATGSGPEMMWVSKEDMVMLAEKDMLMDLSELIPTDIYKQLFPCVIQDGTVNGRMVGIAPSFSVVTMAVPNSVWNEDSWTLSDMLEIAEGRDDWEMLRANPYKSSNFYLFISWINGLEGTPFLDLKQNKAHFDHEDFARLMELCMKYGNAFGSDPEYVGWNEVGRLMHEGGTMAQLCYINLGFTAFSSYMADFGDEIHMVGYPSSVDSGHYMSSPNGYLVVNRNSDHLEEIKDYITLLLDYDNQLSIDMDCCVRKDVTRERIQVNFDGEPIILINEPSYGMIQSTITDLKPDGTTYIEEFMAFLENCVPKPEDPSQITAILHEEIAGYFSGSKSLEDTVDVLQNRIQLYLDENGGG